jgi:hypothetical protein
MMTSPTSNPASTTVSPAKPSASSENHPAILPAAILSSAMALATLGSTAGNQELESASTTSDHFSTPVLAGEVIICVILMLTFGGILLYTFPLSLHSLVPSYSPRAPCSHPSRENTLALVQTRQAHRGRNRQARGRWRRAVSLEPKQHDLRSKRK